MNKSANKLFYLCCFATLLTWGVMQLGAYTRLTHAGLGCPDWPGCYGHINVAKVSASQLPHSITTTRQAWTEMVHRYLAASLITTLLLLFIGLFWRVRPLTREIKVVLSLLLFVILVQALLGMWTVTEKLHPTIVTAHLLGGMSLAALLTWLSASLSQWNLSKLPQQLWSYKLFSWGAIVLILLQISLGGWTSSNYAALACPTFPDCNGCWSFPTHLRQAFPLFSGLGINYQGGVLAMAVRMTIQMVHRYGAVILATYLLLMSAFLYIKIPLKSLRINLVLMLVLLVLQITLGLINVLYLLPLSIAVAHNGVAALLLMSVVLLNYQLSRI